MAPVKRCEDCGGVLPGPNGTGDCECGNLPSPERLCPADGCDNCSSEAKAEAREKARAAEAVAHPAHYGGDTVYEVIKVLRAWGLDRCAYLFNVVKYVARAGKKDPAKEIEDLEKAAYYLNEKIKVLKGEV